jgi:DNA mismatch repair ATPase MutS
MKSFLMFKDRDFDPDQILITREKKYRSQDKPNLEKLIPANAPDLIQDLGLEILFNTMAEGDNFLSETAKVAVLSILKDVDSILYRQNILKDCIKNEKVVRDIYNLTIETIEREKEIYGWGLFRQTPDSILHQARNKLEMFSEMLLKLRTIVERNENDFDSEGFKRLFKMLKEELSEEYLDELNYQLNELKFKDGILVSAELGFGNKGTNYVLHKPPKDNRKWWERLFQKKLPGYTYQLHPRDEAGARALSELRNQTINDVANSLAQAMEHILGFFQALRTELAFYFGCLNLHNKLKKLNEPVCFPEPSPIGKKCLSFAGLYDVNLALSSGNKMVGNELDTDRKNLFIITGANTGGKSTYLRSIGIAQFMVQAGMFVPAESFSAEIRNSIFTHFKREEDVEMKSGKLDEELSRMSEIVDKINSGSMILLNESFSATNEKEGSEIARQITSALIERGINVFFVTHQFDFANRFYEKYLDNAIFLLAERLPDGTRTFKIKEGKPMQTNYGEDLYNEIFLKKDDVKN